MASFQGHRAPPLASPLATVLYAGTFRGHGLQSDPYDEV